MSTRDRILEAAAGLLIEGGREAVSTRAVSAAAGVQAPTLYRLFGDKDGLLDAVAAYGLEEYLADKRAQVTSGDPVEDLRRGWDLHVEFGLARPAFYRLIYGEVRVDSRAGEEGDAILRGIASRVAAAGRLAMTVERAAELVHATGVGVVLALIAVPPEKRDLELSVLARESVIRTITTDAAPGRAAGVASKAVALREALREEPGPLTDAEAALLGEWLDRLADHRDQVRPPQR